MRLLPRLRHQLQAVLQQPGSIGVHSLVGFAANAQIAVFRTCPRHGAHNTVPVGVLIRPAYYGCCRTRAEGEGGELREHIIAGSIGLV